MLITLYLLFYVVNSHIYSFKKVNYIDGLLFEKNNMHSLFRGRNFRKRLNARIELTQTPFVLLTLSFIINQLCYGVLNKMQKEKG